MLTFRHHCLVLKTCDALPQGKLQEVKASSKTSAGACLLGSCFALLPAAVVCSWAKQRSQTSAERDTDTSGMFRPSLGLTWLPKGLKSYSFLAPNICGYETCCHQQVPFSYTLSPALKEKKKKLQKSFNSTFESCQRFPSQHMLDPRGSTQVRCLHFL